MEEKEIEKKLEDREALKEIFGDVKLNENQEGDEALLLQKIEATLFLAARFLDVDEIVKFTGINPLSVKEVMDKLLEKYQEQGNALIIHKREIEGKILYKMDVKKEFYSLVNRIVTGQTEFTKAEQETLAIIAYKQPIKQSTIVKIRGNKSYDHIKHFIEMGLVKAKKSGRTLELGLSEEFYNYFNVKDKSGE
jgi:segregation and condensation protein B